MKAYNDINAFIKCPPMKMNNFHDCRTNVEEIRRVWLSSFPKKALDKSYTHKIYQRGNYAVCGFTKEMFKIFGVYETTQDAQDAIEIASNDEVLGSLYKKIIDFMIIDLRAGPIVFPFPEHVPGLSTSYYDSDPYKEFWNHHHFDLKTECDTIQQRMKKIIDIKQQESSKKYIKQPASNSESDDTKKEEDALQFTNIETEMKVLGSTTG